MSRKRYISTEISNDEKIADLADLSILGTLLYTWAIPHMDDWGRITGNPREFKLLVCPGLDISNRDVEEAINHIINVKLWVRYEVDGKKCISVLNQENWFKHQSYIGKDKRLDDSKSSFPAPQNTEERRETPNNAEEERETPQNPVSFSLSSSVSPSINTYSYHHVDEVNIFKSFEKEGFGKITEMTSEFLIDLETTYTALWVVKAMKAAVKQGVMKISYIEKILKEWKATGHAEPWTLDKPAEQQKSNVHHFNRGGTSRKQPLPIIADSPKSPPMSPEKKAAAMLRAKLLDGDITREQYDEQILQYEPRASPD